MAAASRLDFKHSDNAVLIQLVDPGMEFPDVDFPFKSRHQFRFLDIQPHDFDAALHFKDAITDEQALEIAQILLNAFRAKQDIIVHCVAGLCRSGAVAEVAIAALKYDATRNVRQPNNYIKNKLFDALDTLGYFNAPDCVAFTN